MNNLTILFLLVLTCPGWAQSSAGIAWVTSQQSVNSPIRISANGVRGAGDVQVKGVFHLTGMLEKQFGTFQGSDITWLTGAAGPKLIWEHRVSPLAYGLVGRSRVAVDVVRDTSLYVEAGGGVQWRLAHHWAWETTLAYTQTRYFDLTQRQIKLTTGIRFR